MRVGIDCRTILNPEGEGELAGVGHYTYELVKHLISLRHDAELVLFFDHRMTATHLFRAPRVSLRQFPLLQYKRFLPFVASHAVVPWTLAHEQLDVFHGPANVLPLFYRGRSVVTVHDLAIYRHPAWFPSRQQFSTQVLIPSAIRRAGHVIAVSHSTANELRQLFHVPEQRMTTIYEGISKPPRFSESERRHRLQRFRLAHPFVLFVGTLEPRKNLPRLVRAFDRLVEDPELRRKYPKLDLVMAGAMGIHARSLFKIIRGLRHPFRIKHVGYVSQEEKFALYQSAEAFAFPSLWEGFGLPVLEAMAFGTPVLSSNISALPEVMGDSGLLVNPEHEDEIRQGLRRLLLDPSVREKMVKTSAAQIKKFDWEQTARQTFEIYQRVARSNESR